MTEYAIEYGDESERSDSEEPSGSQEEQNFSSFFGSEEFRFDPTVFQTLLRGAVRDEISQHEDVVSDAHRYLPHSDTEMMQVLEEFRLTRSGTEVFGSPDERDVEMVRDSFSGSAIFESSQEEATSPTYLVAESQDSDDELQLVEEIPYEEWDGGPLEFDTMNEAQEYAARVAREIFDEIVDELTREELGESGVLDATFEELEQLCMEKVAPLVWDAMDDD